ncbi:adenylate/guanylate cyclase domain-containing protein [Streptomyces sp. NBC_00063]|uniref:adenylate/guanylate cyclase domain-containing protein n=1 Tax=Streptomyces sp. NBC_00063 TaxID=2975638 RepID=UPI003D7546E0
MATDHYRLFHEASMSSERPYQVILFADLSGSTEMKTKTGEVNWLSTIGKFLDITTEAITSHGGTVVKYLGDGTLAAFDSEHAAEAINAAIRIQAMLFTENRNNSVKECLATVGIATGHVVEYEAPGGAWTMSALSSSTALRACAMQEHRRPSGSTARPSSPQTCSRCRSREAGQKVSAPTTI